MTAIRKRRWTTPKGERKAAWVVDYSDQSGKRRNKQFAKKKDAEAWQVKANWEVRQGLHTPDSQSITVNEAAKLWIAQAEAEGRERSTLHQYRGLARNHIIPLLGETKLSRLSKPIVENYRDQLLASRSVAMTRKAVRALSSVINEAQRRGLVAQNVAHGIRIQKTKSTERVEIPAREELKAIIAAATDDELPLILTAVFTGLRSSELRGLPWHDIDFENALLTVSQRADQWCKIGQPKSDAGFRTIPMPPMLVSTLRKWKLRAVPSPLKLVFPSSTGQPHWYQNLLRRTFIPLQIKAGVTRETEKGVTGKYGFHALRHAAASGWIEQKIDLKRLQVWMGHSSVQITLDTYGHLIKDADKDAAIAAEAQRLLLG